MRRLVARTEGHLNLTNRTQKQLGSGSIAKSEPEQILKGNNLAGKVVVVTGSNSGIGLETTWALQATLALKSERDTPRTKLAWRSVEVALNQRVAVTAARV